MTDNAGGAMTNNTRSTMSDSTEDIIGESANGESALYFGQVRHRRFMPRAHRFQYSLMQWWLALDELSELGQLSRLFSTDHKWAPLHFNPTDYLRGQWEQAENLQDAVLALCSKLHGAELTGKVFFLGNLRCWGLFFSPLNCYFIRDTQGAFTHMLAEVSNTPWQQRHYYLVDLSQQLDTRKAFHVSPFNPMDMVYHWHIKPPQQRALIHIAAHRQQCEFDATMALSRQPLNQKAIYNVLKKHPIMSLKIVAGIYWQALKLFIKRVPFYSHPGKSSNTAD